MSSDAGPLLHATRMAYLALTTTDLDRLSEHYTDVLGLVATHRRREAVYLTTGPEHHCLVLETVKNAADARIGIEIAEPLELAAVRLREAAIPFRRRTEPEPGIAADLVLDDVPTAPLHLYEKQTESGTQPTFGPRPAKYGHVAWRTTDSTAAREFFETMLGFRWSDSVDDRVHFMRCDPNHHCLNLFGSDGEGDSGLHHFAFEARDSAHLTTIADHLATANIRLFWGLGRHGPGHNMFSYHLDPEGHVVEISADMDLVFDESVPAFQPRPWHEDLPQRPKVWPLSQEASNKWGPLPQSLAEEIERSGAASAPSQ